MHIYWFTKTSRSQPVHAPPNSRHCAKSDGRCYLTRVGIAESIVVDSSDAVTPHQFLPDGVGGLLIRAEGLLIRYDLARERTEHVISPASRIDLVGQGGIVYVQTRTGIDNFYGITEALNVTTFTSLWIKSSGWKLTPAKPDGGGIALDSANELLDIDSSGEPARTTSFGLSRPVQVFSQVIGQGTSTAEVNAVALDALDATLWNATLEWVAPRTDEPSSFGNREGQTSPRVLDFVHFIADLLVDAPNLKTAQDYEQNNLRPAVRDVDSIRFSRQIRYVDRRSFPVFEHLTARSATCNLVCATVRWS